MVHFPEDEAEPLRRAEDGAEGFQITVMVRCDVYRGSQSRGRGTPSPREVRVTRKFGNAPFASFPREAGEVLRMRIGIELTELTKTDSTEQN